jgi:hypothetical protein
MSGYRLLIPIASPLTTLWLSFTAVWVKSRNPLSNQPGFADQKDDLPAGVYPLEFLRKHPEVETENVTWHTHELTDDPGKKPAKIEYQYIPGAGG